jgi:hypothetical protein
LLFNEADALLLLLLLAESATACVITLSLPLLAFPMATFSFLLLLLFKGVLHQTLLSQQMHHQQGQRLPFKIFMVVEVLKSKLSFTNIIDLRLVPKICTLILFTICTSGQHIGLPVDIFT